MTTTSNSQTPPPMSQPDVDWFVRCIYATFPDDTLREMIEFGQMATPEFPIVMVNTALQHELDRRQKEREDEAHVGQA